MGVAVKVTVVPRGKEATQAEEQEMPPGLLVTIPLPGPEVFTDKVTKSGAGVAALIVSESAWVSAWFKVSVTRTVKFAVPAVVGVPEITPPGLKDSIAGSEPVKLQVSAPMPPVAWSV